MVTIAPSQPISLFHEPRRFGYARFSCGCSISWKMVEHERQIQVNEIPFEPSTVIECPLDGRLFIPNTIEWAEFWLYRADKPPFRLQTREIMSAKDRKTIDVYNALLMARCVKWQKFPTFQPYVQSLDPTHPMTWFLAELWCNDLFYE